ncbi:hypothetical protein H6G33_05070 [Calothrix sp. FACHB-1219]|uniref:hypothetical protein n=1 Tax=unclassified Calothrix TaxID=2619626 RepID=UPI001685C621|nr:MULTISPECIES: hypothetical protein [unclassified Calothrix]MBD2203306.1 hypothetical protein [Calothrix sp. FACHB-168]MBD2216398.1 hypothetical protein [Calothrix sp. FACHB-1219]
MNSPPKARIISLSTILLLSITSLASAETPRNRDSSVLPYLLDNPNDSSLVRVRCLPSNRVERTRRIMRDSLLRPNQSDNQTLRIDIEGNCQNLRIRVHDDNQFSDFPDYNPDLEDSWLTRKGSGWYWFLRHPQNQPQQERQ